MSHRKILLLSIDRHDQLRAGIESYAQQYGWQLSTVFSKEALCFRDWHVDGVLALNCLPNVGDYPAFMLQDKIPIVHVGMEVPRFPTYQIAENHVHDVQLVIEHFLARGFRQFAYYDKSNKVASQLRGQAFQRLLNRAGYPCDMLVYPMMSPAGTINKYGSNALIHYLHKVTPPVAIMTGDSKQAAAVVKTCADLDLVVPTDISIVAAQNTLNRQDSCTASISCVLTDEKKMGYQSAKLLDQLMHGVQPASKVKKIAVSYLEVHQSSNGMAVNNRYVTKCLELFESHSHEKVKRDNQRIAADASSSTIHMAFLKTLKCTPGQALRQARIERAKRYLLQTEFHKLDSIATACGLKNANSLCVLFSTVLGFTPGSFRKEFRPEVYKISL